MISSEEVSIALGAVIELKDLGRWSSGLRIKLRGEQISEADSLRDADWLESVVCGHVKRIEALVERLPEFPVDENVVKELFWLVEKIETLRFQQEESLAPKPSEKEAAAPPVESSNKSLRTQLEAAVDGWRISYAASLSARKSSPESPE
jgi:hypothetical protein